MADGARGRPSRRRRAAAWQIARPANAVCFDSEHSQPAISPAQASITNAVQPKPEASGTQVKSATCS
jgi:hypothetical protein